MPSEPIAVTPQTMLPDLLRAYPQARPVLDAYGLRGCGGPYGPAESIAYFARAHDVDEARLLDELRAARGNPPPATDALARSGAEMLADSIYRRFFLAALAVVMTAGATWGALLLLRIGAVGSFTALSVHDVNAHGHAQIFGWVGLFVMGFAYQAFPRMKHTSLWRPGLANLSFYLMLFGILARAVGEPLHAVGGMRALALLAGAAEITAIGLFVTIIVQTLRTSGKRWLTADAFAVAALAFFFVQAIYDLWLLFVTTAPGLNRDGLLYWVSHYQAPLRDLQIHGFALLIILGVGLRMFPALFGFRSPQDRTAAWGLTALVAALVAEVFGYIWMRQDGGPAAIALMYGGMLVLAGVSIALTWHWGIAARPTEQDRSVKFIRAGIVWLHVSMLLLVLLPVYMYLALPAAGSLSHSGAEALAMGFSHAYFGAVRHAITVGFISLMILGMAAKVVPTLNGVDIRRLGGLWLPFVLINVGCAMRVGFQVATDFAAWAYPIAGVSGLLELTAIGLWGFHLWRIMRGWQPSAATGPITRITADDRIGHIVQQFPQTLPLLLARGFAPLANPLLRRTLARGISVRQAANQQGLDVDDLVRALNGAAFGADAVEPPHRDGMQVALPVLAPGA